jgi:anti-sigma-K factor RskA
VDTEAYISSGILEAYALGMASAEEAAILECVVKHNVQIREALAEISRTLEDLADTTSQPAPDLKATIWARLQSAPLSKTTSSVLPAPETPAQPISTLPENAATGRTLPWRMLAMAASLLLVVSTVGFFRMRQAQQDSQAALVQQTQLASQQESRLARYAAKEALLAQPGMQVVPLNGVEAHPEARAMVYWDSHNHNVYLDNMALPQPPSGKQYQLWAIVDGKPVSAGLDAADATQSLATIDKAQAFAITLEPSGGSVSPTLTEMVVMGEVKG